MFGGVLRSKLQWRNVIKPWLAYKETVFHIFELNKDVDNGQFFHSISLEEHLCWLNAGAMFIIIVYQCLLSL